MSHFDKMRVSPSLSWDDLRVVLALANFRVLGAAASHLKISQTTVFRRIKEIEDRLGVRLFDRGRHGYVPTSAATALIEVASQFDEDVNRIALSLAGLDTRPIGKVRLSTTDTIMSSILREVLAPLHQALPLVQIELQSSNQVMNLNKREADVCIRPCDVPPDYLIGKCIGKMASTIYAPTTWEPVNLENLSDYPWLAPDESLSHLSSTRWLQDQGLLNKAVLTSNSRLNLEYAAGEGLGLVVLPCYVGDRSEKLKRVCPPIKDFDTELWLLYHPELRSVRRVSEFIETIYRLLLPFKPLLDGSSTQ